MRVLLIAIFFAAVAFLAPLNATAQVKTRVRFPTGASSTAVKDTIRGYAYRDYVVRASADQTINVSVDSRNANTVFSIVRPDRGDVDGAVQTNEFSGTLPITGDYVTRVAMMRSGARRPGAVSNFTLKISID